MRAAWLNTTYRVQLQGFEGNLILIYVILGDIEYFVSFSEASRTNGTKVRARMSVSARWEGASAFREQTLKGQCLECSEQILKPANLLPDCAASQLG